MSGSKKEKLPPLLLAIFAICASILMYWITTYGPGVSPDSAVYIVAAKNLLAGNGLYAMGEPMTHYPPVYPFLLAATSFLQPADIIQSARLLHSLLFGVNIVLVGVAVQICTEYNLLASSVAMLLVSFSAPVIYVHSMAWSESPFIAFMLAAFILLSKYIVKPTQITLLAASFFLAMAVASRYIGVALIIPLVFVLLSFGDRPMKGRLRDTITAVSVTCLPLIAWFIRNLLIAQTTTDRSFSIHLVGYQHLRSLIVNLHDFFFPLSLPVWVKALNFGLAIALFMAALVLLHRRNGFGFKLFSTTTVLLTLCFVFCLSYIAALFISLSFFDAYTPLDERILLPVYICIVITLPVLVHNIKDHVTWLGLLSLLLLSVSINSVFAIREIMELHNNGIGYTSPLWRNSDVISQVKSLRSESMIYSNGPDVIELWTGKDAVMIPAHTFAGTTKPNKLYEEQLQDMLEACREGDAIIVYLDNITWRWYLPSPQELEADLNLEVLSQSEDGTIYGGQKR